MSSNIKHLILTRFNVPSPGKEQSIRAQPGWLEGRFDLFRKYCLPGVADQSERDFEWIVFFDEQTPDPFKATIRQLQSVFPFRAEFTRLYRMPDIVPQILGRYADSEWLLTTRLDSDDVLAADHVARLREAVRAGSKEVINFSEGAIVSVAGEQPRLYRIRDRKNPFASLMEPMGPNARSIWAEMHVNIGRLAPVREIGGDPAWLQVVHGGNVSNRVKGRRIRIDSVADLFPAIAERFPVPAETDLGIAAENIAYTLPRQAHGLLRFIAARVGAH